MADELENPYKWVMPWDLDVDPASLQFNPAAYFQAMGSAATPQPQPQPPLQLVESAPVPPPTSGSGFSLPSFSMPSNEAMGTAAMLGGLALGLGAPQVGPQALQNFSAINLMQNRDEYRRQAQERLELQKQIEQRRENVILAQKGLMRPGMDPDLIPLAEQERARRVRAEAEFYGTPPPQGNAPVQVNAPSQAPQPSEVPHYQAVGGPGGVQLEPTQRNIDPGQGPIRLDAAQPGGDFMFPSQPQRPPGNVSRSLTVDGMTITKSQPTVDPKVFATQRAVAELSELVATQDEAVQADPRKAFRVIMQRYPDADAADVKRELTNSMINAHVMHAQATDPNIDPKSAYIIGFNGARQDLGLLFSPPDSARTMSTQVPSLEERRSAAYGTPGEKDTQRRLNQIDSNREAAVTAGRNIANFETLPLTPEQLQHFEQPLPYGTTGSQAAGRAPMSEQRKVNVDVTERERSQTQVAIQDVAPAITSIVTKAEQIRGEFEKMSGMGLLQQGANWVDYAQSTLTGVPLTEFGKLVKTYDDLVKTNGVMLARAYQGQKGNLTETERKIGDQGFPQTFKELYNNPQGANDRMAVMSEVMALELRDPNFRIPRLNVPATPFEQSVEAARQQRIATRPDLYSQVGAAPPPVRQAPLAPPPPAPAAPAPPTMLSPEEQSLNSKIDADIKNSLSKRKKN